MNLVLFTSTYPVVDGREQPFLDVEIQHLRRVFERIILIPKKYDGKSQPLPQGVEVDESYAALLNSPNLFSLAGRIFGSRFIYQELFSRPSLTLHLEAIQRMIRFIAVALLTRGWVDAWLDRNDADGSRSVFYTYWFDSSAMGIGLTKGKHPKVRLVSRVHGYDLYEEYYYDTPYWPFRRQSLGLVDALFPDAEAGLQYLERQYPRQSAVFETSLLGVPPAEALTSPSSDGVLRIVSCSMLVPVKRVGLLLDGILCAAQMRPGQKFEWTHMGNGDTRMELQQRADDQFPPNAKAFFPGYSTKDALMKFYRETPVDIFINVSMTEGTPMSIMEAISCGIPVIATSVGGNAEIVSEQNGILLDSNPTPLDIAKALHVFLDDPQMASHARTRSYQLWSEHYNADVNFHRFAERVRSIREDQ